jgi:hypothetical protein
MSSVAKKYSSLLLYKFILLSLSVILKLSDKDGS